MKKQYIADITVTASTKSKVDLSSMTTKQKDAYAKKRSVGSDGRSKIYTYSFTAEKQPVILEDGVSFPDKEKEDAFIRKHFHRIGVGKFDDYEYKVTFSNVKFSSNLMHDG